MGMSSQSAGIILVVDQSPTDSRVLRDLLTHAGFQVLVAEIEEPAIATAQVAKPDLILLDVQMPDLDGFELCRRLKASDGTRSIPVIFLGALDAAHDRAKGYQLGAVGFIPKPFQSEEVLVSVETQMQLQTLIQTEIQLREMSTALGNAVEGISRLDEQGRYVFINDAYARTVGYASEEMVGMAWQKTVHPDDLDRLIAAYQSMQAQGKVELEARGIRKDGSIFYEQLFMIAAYNEQQQFRGHYCFMKDISERKQLEAERKQADQKIREQAALLDIATDAIFVRDVNHQILYWNRGAEKIYGWKAEEVLGKKTTEFLYSEVPSQLAIALKTTLAQGEWQGEFYQITKSERPIVVQSRWTLVRDELGQPKWILTVNTDMTEKKQLESKFLRAQRLESIGTLASGIAHDLNNILTPILAVSQLLPLKFQDLDDRTQQLLDILEANSKRGAELVKQVLSFARGVEGRRTPLQMGHLLVEIEQIAKRTFPKSIKIRTDIPKAQLWLVSADATQLHQVIMNLCVNARDAMSEGGTLSLTAENHHLDQTYARMHPEAKAGPYVVITIADTGMGIQPEVLDRIFDPFFTTKAVGKGTGLGLSTAMGIVKSHNGFISVYSEVNQGTKFKVYLPAVEEVEIVLDSDRLMTPGQGELILVVDDEPYIQEIAKVTLEDYNYHVITAANGFEAITLYAKRHREISLVIMDLLMPSMDGLVAIRTLQKINPHVKVIATSLVLTGFESWKEEA
jgi:PAS domain S-box-containing protein